MVILVKTLPVTHLLGGFAEGISRTIPVPATIIRLLTIEDDEFDGMDEVYHILDLIDLYASSHGNRDDLLVIWDSLTAQSISLTDRKPIKDRFFIPVMLSGDNTFGQWKLTDQIVNFEKMTPGDISKGAKSLMGPMFLRPAGSDLDNMLQLVYRLHPNQKWDSVCTAWRIIKSLRSLRSLTRQLHRPHSEDEKEERSWASLPEAPTKNQPPLISRSCPSSRTGAMSQNG